MITPTTMFPLLVTDKLESLKAFYETYFGFQTVFYDPEFYLHLLSPQSGIQLGFMLPAHPSQPEFLHQSMTPEGYVLSFEVADIQQAFDEASRDKLAMVMPLKHEAWGQSHFIVTDPAGFYVDIVQHTENG